MDEKLTDAEREFEKWWTENWQGTTQPAVFDLAFKEVAQKAYARATERTARRCVEICRDHYGQFGEVSAKSIEREFGGKT